MLTDSEEFIIMVDEKNQAPVFTSEPVIMAIKGEVYSYPLAAEDQDLPANELTFEALKIPAWLNFDARTQTLSGTPDKTADESNLIRLQVSDGRVTSIQEYTLTIETPTGIFDRNKQEDNPIVAYPNPTTGQLKIRMNAVEAAELVAVSLLTLEGKLLLQVKGNLQKGEKGVSTFLLNANAGVYLLQLKERKNVRYLKVVKE